MNPTEINLLIKAIDFAAVKHSTQRRKNRAKSPYIEHPIRVMKILSDSGVTDLSTLIAGVLHDTIEDTQTTPEEISREFSPKISQIVMEVTDDKSLPKIERKQGQIDHASSGEMLPESRNVKLADKYANLQDITTDPPTVWSPDEIKGYLNWSYLVCQPMFGNNPILDQQLQQLFATNQIIDQDSKQELVKYYQLLAQKNVPPPAPPVPDLTVKPTSTTDGDEESSSIEVCEMCETKEGGRPMPGCCAKESRQ